jgi:nitrate/TMAO reductase-like tetraheme cytochrome c subunit
VPKPERPFGLFLIAPLLRSPASLVGAALASLSAILFLTLFSVQQFGYQGGGPYLGIISFIVIPALFVLGLILIPLGIWRQRAMERKHLAAGLGALRAPVIDFNQPRTRVIALVVLVLTGVNIVIISTATYQGVETMETTQFCGGACHSVMSPELTAYRRSPHARVRCTECHIGSGANWFVKSKLSGSWQVVSVALNLYPRPIPTPVHSLRPARETCEQCHWPAKFVGEKLVIRSHFGTDEKQTEKKTVLLLNIGGIQQGKGRGIHWHVDPNVHVRYRSDKNRQHIYDVELTSPDSAVKLFKPTREPTQNEVEPDWRHMDCVDCHNRPAHAYKMPDEELDAALETKEIDPSIPFIKKQGLAALEAKYTTQEDARVGIRNALLEFYNGKYPDLVKSDPHKIEGASEVLWNIYQQNVFPQMKIDWGTYPVFLNHAGCSRCHDGEHVATGGEKISKSCDLCHETLATEETDPEILQVLHP